jgi:hypothetical protein
VGRQPPFDASWRARYAIVADPDANDVGLMSPTGESRATWPPEASPGSLTREPTGGQPSGSARDVGFFQDGAGSVG